MVVVVFLAVATRYHMATVVVKVVASRYRSRVTAERVNELLERLANLLRAEERQLGKQLGLQPVQLQALAYLARANRYSDSPVAVADYLGLTKGTVSQTLAVLQQRQLVVASDDPADGRRVHLKPTAKGRRAVAMLPPAVLRAALGDGNEAQVLARSLEQVLVAIQRGRGGRTFGVCRTCRHFRGGSDGGHCGLTGEALAADQTERLCREHEPVVTGPLPD